VTFRGAIPWDEAPRFLASADCFVLPSQPDPSGNLDGLPTTLLEAMACGAPVIASNVAGAPLVVAHGVNGLLTPPAQPAALADAVIALAHDPSLRRRLGAAARHTVESGLTWRDVARQFETIFAAAIARPDVVGDRTRPATSARRGRLATIDGRPVPPTAYDREYYLASMHGAEQFAAAPGESLAPRLHYALDLAQLAPGRRVLDLGCGRGEVAWQCRQRGAIAHALDFSTDAVQIARGLDPHGAVAVEQASAEHLPYADQTFDTVLMLDIIEHLYPDQLLAALREARRVLKPGGRLVAHTMPNADYYRYGYPVYRWLLGLVGRRLPKDPRRRWYRGETHVNIQSPRSLRAALIAAGFATPRVWLQPVSDGPLKRAIAGTWPLKPVLCNDILAVAERR
ncbi:MAG: glycosyltransferase, partial [Dehalococcoidia bacterium]|nr:glycosyltransferase [Dehalococcoidia bacterium]